ncbi:hypothetical protein SPRG_13613 [Saprolegnia parasitica CBS 223.65]|uniref:Peptidase M13 C-terminal domain-containing protein n=1 Tax=Saprolegnia parasitica (strain CBS 223.65) TaxID=695850 RepID=A0A067C1X6_SAPPC|nr:hypothetical protein SPRG_13613 [Saprolegnia parasitica CBS 223.65]KDO20797.1 hypothetical protein SPRG_13613 [Saprolegnia parasitica CBS 223.65]|eukprot:XP_012208456.1 hypothetical protein SPRG_13613 [Saprolegnia parasitica CBS 223.65]
MSMTTVPLGTMSFRTAYGAVEPTTVPHRGPRPWTRRAFAIAIASLFAAFGCVLTLQQHDDTVVVIVAVEEPDTRFDAFYAQTAAMRDDAIDPCHNFYRHACGGWLQNATIPSDANAVDTSFRVVADANAKLIEHIVQSNPPVIGPLYQSCISVGAVDDVGVTAVSAQLAHVASLTSKAAVIAYAGALFRSSSVNAFFSLEVLGNPKNATTNVLSLSQGGLTFPGRDYYVDAHKRAKYSRLFVEYVTSLASVDAFARHNVTAFTHRLLKLETSFATMSVANAALRDPWATYHAFSLADLEAQFPHVAAYLTGAGVYETLANSTIVVSTPDFFASQAALLASDDVDLDTLIKYVSFRLIDSQSPLLGERFRAASHKFHGTLSGLGVDSTRADYCLGLTEAHLGAVLGSYYLERVWDKSTKVAARSLITEIEAAMGNVLSNEPWLDEATRKEGLAKLHHIFNLHGFFANVAQLKAHEMHIALTSIGAPVDPQAWGLSASTVNAYYDPSANKMVFPAAILQAPFYSAHAMPIIANYARIGMVMGHELTHGFDDQGRNYDANGNLRMWWSPSVSKTFDIKADCLAAQYSSFEVTSLDASMRIGFVDGRLTLGENIADNGGLKLAYLAYAATQARPISKAETKLYFTAFAQAWCEKRSDAYAELLLGLDPHSPGKWRVNGPLMNSALFAETFQCPVGSPMNPPHKCVVW